MDYVAKINATILAYKIMAATGVHSVKLELHKEMLESHNDVFLVLKGMYDGEHEPVQGLIKPQSFREVDRLQRLTNFVELSSYARKTFAKHEALKADKLNYILRNCDEEEWNVYHLLLTKQENLFAAPEAPAEEVEVKETVPAQAPKQTKPANASRKRKSSTRNK